MASFVPWMGSKRRLAARLLKLFPSHTCYVEPFCGAAAVFFAKEPVASEVLNDVNGELVNLYRVVQVHLEEFVRQFKWALSSRQVFEWFQDSRPETLTDIQRAARFYYLQRSCFGGKVEGQTFGTTTTTPAKFNLLRIEEHLSEMHLRLARVTVEHLHWSECVRRYDRPHTLFYSDPPYYQAHGYGVPFEIEEYERLASAAIAAKSAFVISVGDHPEMRRVFSGLRRSCVDVTYSVGGGARRKAARELIFRNF